jgi:Protein of unknown function (DUF2782)
MMRFPRPPEIAMRRSLPLVLLPVFGLILALAGCATTGGGNAAADIPPGAEPATRMMANGDEITEYRVAGQLRVVKVQPARGPAYYLYDRNGDGRLDEEKGVSPVYFKLFEW